MIPLALSIAFQVTSALASIGRVVTASYIVSRSLNALALGTVAADFAVKYFVTGRADEMTAQIIFTHRADDLTGLLVFAALTVRTLLILFVPALDGSLAGRRITCAVAFIICAGATIAAQDFGVYPFRMVALLPAIGIGLGCIGESSNEMVMRRRCILAMGCVMAVFAFETAAWGLLFKNLLSDTGASLYSIVKYRDPLPWAPFSRGQRPSTERR